MGVPKNLNEPVKIILGVDYSTILTTKYKNEETSGGSEPS